MTDEFKYELTQKQHEIICNSLLECKVKDVLNAIDAIRQAKKITLSVDQKEVTPEDKGKK